MIHEGGHDPEETRGLARARADAGALVCRVGMQTTNKTVRVEEMTKNKKVRHEISLFLGGGAKNVSGGGGSDLLSGSSVKIRKE